MNKLKKETNDATIKGVINSFRLKKENKAIKDRIIIDIRNLFEHGNIKNIFEHEEENYYKPVIYCHRYLPEGSSLHFLSKKDFVK